MQNLHDIPVCYHDDPRPKSGTYIAIGERKRHRLEDPDRPERNVRRMEVLRYVTPVWQGVPCWGSTYSDFFNVVFREDQLITLGKEAINIIAKGGGSLYVYSERDHFHDARERAVAAIIGTEDGPTAD
ncbi:MAG: hypothetical protein DYG96_12160 [Chlorobi bacterium CHB2]|nr:hypothetical protein [Chlorobi bacterium CHB2]